MENDPSADRRSGQDDRLLETRRRFLRDAANFGILGAGGFFLINDVAHGLLRDPLSPFRSADGAVTVSECDADCEWGCLCNCGEPSCGCTDACTCTCDSCGCDCGCGCNCPCSCGCSCHCACNCACPCQCACACACTCATEPYQGQGVNLFGANVDGTAKATDDQAKRPTARAVLVSSAEATDSDTRDLSDGQTALASLTNSARDQTVQGNVSSSTSQSQAALSAANQAVLQAPQMVSTKEQNKQTASAQLAQLRYSQSYVAVFQVA